MRAFTLYEFNTVINDLLMKIHAASENRKSILGILVYITRNKLIDQIYIYVLYIVYIQVVEWKLDHHVCIPKTEL